LSVIKAYKNLNASNRFLVNFPLWLLFLFGVFYWGKYWSYSPIGEYLDSTIRASIMPILDTFLDNPIIDYDIVINPKYRVVITPECNGIIPYLMILSAILAYPCKITQKIVWAILSFFIFFIINIIRLYIVAIVVSKYGTNWFYLIHDIGGNLLLIITGATIFLLYLKRCNVS